MTLFRSRLVRIAVAVSTMHLMLALPAGACPSITTAQTADANDMTMLASHAEHHMPATTGMTHEHQQAPAAPKAPAKHRMPCCPSPVSLCAGIGCASGVVTVVVAATSELTPTHMLPSSGVTERWTSFVHAPEPPPPRA